MTELVLFHHVQGLTGGVRALADDLREAGHTVHTPDVFEGRTFATLAEGMAFARESGFDTLTERAVAAAETLGPDLVYAGISFGVMAAQRLAQTRPGARGALLLESCVPVTGDWAFGPWPAGVPVQVHGMAEDPEFAGGGDLDAARELVEVVGAGAELFTYPGDQHLFTDRSLASYDAPATALLLERALAFLART